MELHVRLLTTAERKDVFRRHMKYDFPQDELRPLRMIQNLVQKGTYYTYGIYEADVLCAYAYFWEETDAEILLFDYFAVNRMMRGQGYGTEAMKVILEVCQGKNGVILEVENPDTADTEEERSIRKRRIAFYERCGLCMSEVRIWLFGVEYCMMYTGITNDDINGKIVEVMQKLYQGVLPGAVYRKMLKVL